MNAIQFDLKYMMHRNLISSPILIMCPEFKKMAFLGSFLVIIMNL